MSRDNSKINGDGSKKSGDRSKKSGDSLKMYGDSSKHSVEVLNYNGDSLYDYTAISK